LCEKLMTNRKKDLELKTRQRHETFTAFQHIRVAKNGSKLLPDIRST